MPQLAANLIFNSKDPNFARDQVQTMAELEAYGIGEGKTPIDIGHITFVIEENTHYTYVELADGNGHGTGEYAWVPFTRAPGGGSGGDDEGGEDDQPTSVYAYFKSMVFKRGGLEAPPTPGNGWNPELADYGGTYTDPCPLGWSDGIPPVTNQQEQVIWMSTRIFSSGGQADSLQARYNWTTPQMIADSESRDYEFSSSKETPAPPQKTWAGDETDYNDGWSNTADESTVWMAMIDVESGIYRGNWEIVKIKGEDGQQATIIKILGTKNDVSELPSSGQYLEAFIVIGSQGNYVYTWDGDSWNNCGKFKGTYDPSKDWAYLHIKYSDDGHTFTAAFGEVPGGWVGTYCDYEIDDSTTFSDYYWKEIVKEDAFGKEEIFYLTSTDEAPRVPTSHDTYNGKTWEDYDFVPPDWYDDYPGVSTQARYCWYCSRRKIDGVWDEFRGVDGKTGNEEGGVAKLYTYLPADAVASAASRTFMAYTWTDKTPSSSADNPVPIVPEALAADVATWDVQNNTLVLAENKSWQTNTDTTIDGVVVKATWSTNPGNNPGKYLWLSTATFSEAGNGAIVGVWSDPVCISGEDGRNGTDGEWKAFAYRLCRNQAEFSTLVAPSLNYPYKDADDFTQASIDLGWKDHPEGISEEYPIEAASIAVRDRNTEEWTYDAPFIWSRWGEDGIDGDGIEYLYFIATTDDVQDVLDPNTHEPTGKKELKAEYYLPQNLTEFNQYLESIGITRTDAKSEAINTFYTDRQNEWLPDGNLGQRWTDDPSDVSQFEPYEFVSMRKYRYDSSAPGESEKDKYRWGFWSKPALWAKFGQDGDGRSVFTSMVFCRTSRWKLDTAELSGGTMISPKPTSTMIEVLVNEESRFIDLQNQEDNDPPLVWSDSVPPTPASAPVWMASRVFNTDESTPWSTPVELHDAPGFQVEYTAEEKWNYNALPSLNNPRYHDDNQYEGINEALWREDAEAATQATWGDIGTGGTDIVDPWWMITSRKTSGGQWTNWAIFKIKGEKGETGTSIHIKGSFDSYKNLGDPTIDPDYGRVNHTVDDDTKVADGDCYVVKGLLWIYDGNSTETLEGPYSEAGIRDTSNIENGDQYAGFICQGQFKGDPGDKGESSWLFIRFANESDDQETEVDSTNEDRRYKYNNKVYIEFTDNYGTVPGKYSGTYIARENSASLSMKDYTWSEWRGDDLYGTEQIFILSALNPCQDLEHLDQQPGRPMPPDEENANEDKSKWYEFEHVPTGWSDGPLTPTPDAHCWVSTRRLSDPDDKEWKTPVIYSRYAKDGDRGEDGAVNEFIYHLGEETTVFQKILATAKKGSSDPIEVNDLDWWESDESRDYRPGDGFGGYWTDNPSGVLDEAGKHVEYYCYRTRDYDEENNKYFWTPWSPIKVWSTWGKKGNDGDGIEYIFTVAPDASEHKPTNPTPDWTVEDKDTYTNEAGKHWNDYDFVPDGWTDDPQGPDDTDRFEFVSIRRSHSENGVTTWDDFSDPAIWSMYVEDGKDGDSQEFIFCRSTSRDPNDAPGLDTSRAFGIVNGTPTYYGAAYNQPEPNWQNLRDFVPGVSGKANEWWSDNPQGVEENIPLEYYSVRFRKDEVWTPWSDVMVWSEWGKKGKDGDGVEYIFKATQSSTLESSARPNGDPYGGKTWKDDDFVPSGWEDDPPTPDRINNRYIWVSMRKTIAGEWGNYGTEAGQNSWSNPILWTSYLDNVLEQRVYHYGTKTSAPSLVQWVQQGGESVRPDGYQNDNYLPKDSSNVSWTAQPQGITSDDRYEWEAIRSKDPETGVWGDYGPRHLYSVWGDDGNGIEFVFWLVTAEEKAYIDSQTSINPDSLPGDDTSVDDYFPYISLGQGNRTDVRADDIPGNMSAAYPFLYASKRDKKNGVWQPFCPIFIFNQLNTANEYACTLNLSEDFQGIATIKDGDSYKSITNNVSAGRNMLSLNYGPDILNISKVSIQPVQTDATTGTTSFGETFEIWKASANGNENSRSLSIDGNTITFTVTKNGNNALLRWSSSSSLVFKHKNDEIYDVSFVVSATETEASDSKGGFAPYNIHPVLGNVLYELAPKVDVFKKLTSAPYNAPQSLVFEIEKNIYSDGKPASTLVTPDDWNAGLKIEYRQDEGSPITISGNLTSVQNQAWSSAISGSGDGYSWTVRGYTENVQNPYVQVSIYLYSGGNDLAANVVSGYTAELYEKIEGTNNYKLHDSEFIPALYDGKKGTKGDYYKYEYAYFLTDTDTWSSSNNPQNGVNYPATDTSNHKAWRSTIVTPDSTFRFLFATKRLCKYYGDDVDDNGNAVEAGSPVNESGNPGPWEDVFLYASKSLPDNQIRSIDTITEYYKWTPNNQAPSKTPIDDWSENQIPTAGTNDRYLWNFEVITYTYGIPEYTETEVGKVGYIGEDGRGVSNFQEYYFWSALPTGNGGTYGQSGVAFPTVQASNLNSTSNPLKSWWTSDQRDRLNAQRNESGANRKYLWNFERITYTKGTPNPEDSEPVMISELGDPGRSVTSFIEYYKWMSTSGTPSTPDISTIVANISSSSIDGWYKDSMPSPGTSDKYLWNFEVITYSYDNPTKTPPARIGTIGENGKGISGVTDYYFWSHRGTGSAGAWSKTSNYAYPLTSTIDDSSNASASWWSAANQDRLSAQVADEERRYLWNFEAITYEGTPNPVNTQPVLIAINGTNGDVGKGIQSVTEYYLWTVTNDLTQGQQDAANLDDPTSASGENQWRTSPLREFNLWSRKKVSDSTGTNNTVTYHVDKLCTFGSGKKVSSVTIYYKKGSSSAPTDTEWSTTPPTLTSSAPALWAYEVVTFSDNTTAATNPTKLATPGYTGCKVDVAYLIYEDDTTPTSANSMGWAALESAISVSNLNYLWNFEVTTYTDGSSYSTEPALIGGVGSSGTDGRGIVSIQELYYWGTNVSTNLPNLDVINDMDEIEEGEDNKTWWDQDHQVYLEQQSEISEDRRYLWNFEKITYTTGEPDITTPIIISTRGLRGDDGNRTQFVYFRTKTKNLSTATLLEYDSVDHVFIDNGEAFPVFRYADNSQVSPGGGTTYIYVTPANHSAQHSDSSEYSYVTDDPEGVNSTWKYEYESIGRCDDGENWVFSKPVLHSNYSTNGTNATYTKYLYKATNDSDYPTPFASTDTYPKRAAFSILTNNTYQWKESIADTTFGASDQYLWAITTEATAGVSIGTANWTRPIVTSVYGGPGKDAVPIRIRSLQEVWGVTLRGDFQIYSGFEDNAPFRDIITVSEKDWLATNDSSLNNHTENNYPFKQAVGSEQTNHPVLVVVNYGTGTGLGGNLGLQTPLSTLNASNFDSISSRLSDTVPANKATSLGQNMNGNWWSMFQNLGGIYADLLVAAKAYIDYLQVGQLTTVRSDGYGGSHLEISGGFITFYDGNGKKRIRIGQPDGTGKSPVLEFYDGSERLLYDLGPTGIRWASDGAVYDSCSFSDGITVARLCGIGDNVQASHFLGSGLINKGPYYAFTPAKKSGTGIPTQYYNYNQRQGDGISGHGWQSVDRVFDYNGLLVPTNSAYSLIPNGASSELDVWPQIPGDLLSNTLSKLPDGWYIDNTGGLENNSPSNFDIPVSESPDSYKYPAGSRVSAGEVQNFPGRFTSQARYEVYGVVNTYSGGNLSQGKCWLTDPDNELLGIKVPDGITVDQRSYGTTSGGTYQAVEVGDSIIVSGFITSDQTTSNIRYASIVSGEREAEEGEEEESGPSLEANP